MMKFIVLAGAILVAGCGAVGGGGSGSTTPPAATHAAVSREDHPAQPLNTQLVARRGAVVATISDWQLRYEGTISDGRPRFLESVSSGEQKDVVFDPKRSRAYPFGGVAIEIVRSTPELLVYRIRAAD